MFVVLVGFVLVWLTHQGRVLALAGMLAVILLLVAMDDVAQHAFGIATPLDAIWKHGLRRVVHSLL